MKIEFLSWKTEGLRCADMKIDLSKSGNATQLNVILMQNGCGKTTLTELIRATLTGNIRDWDKERISETKSASKDVSDGKFTLVMLFDDRKTTFEVDFNFEDNELSMSTSSAQQRGHQEGYFPPTDARIYLKPEFVDYFIYDGEKADNLFIDEKKETTKALNKLYGLDYLDEIIEYSKDHLKRLRDESATKKSANSKVTEIATKIEQFKKRKDKLEWSLEDKEEEKKKYEVAIKELNVEIQSLSSSDNDLQQQRNETDKKLMESKNNFENEAKSIWETLKNPGILDKNVNRTLIEFKDNLDTLKLPEQSNEQFFDELISEDECICGRVMDKDAKEKIIKNAKKYMGSKHTDFINAMKSQVKDNLEDASILNIKDLSQKLIDQNKNIEKLHNEIGKLDHLIKDDDGRSRDDINKDKTSLEGKIAVIDNWIEECNTEDSTVRSTTPPERINSIVSINNRLDELEKERTDILELNKIDNAVKKLNALLESTKSDAIKLIREQVKNKMNELSPKIITQDQIMVEEISERIKTVSSKGSAGQKLVLGYLFLTTITNKDKTHNKLPLFVDSPCGATDDVNRLGLARHLPSLSNQLIFLIHVAERPYFGTELIKNDNGNSSYYTVFRKSPETEHFIKNKPDSLELFKDSAQVSTREFFEKFEVAGGAEEDREVSNNV